LNQSALTSTALPTARGHDPIADLRIHPGELNPLLALPEETVPGIDRDSKARSSKVIFNDVSKLGENKYGE